MQTHALCSGSGRSLRVGIVGLRVQEARRYYVSVQVLAGGGLPAGADNGMDVRPGQVARTETSDVSRNPEFAACNFVLRLPQPLGSTAMDAPLLRLDLFAAATLESSNAIPGAGRQLDDLVGSGVVACRGDLAARLLRGERVAMTVALGDAPTGPGEAGVSGSSVALAPLATSTSLGLRTGLGRGQEVLLELMLLDAHITLPSDAFAAKAARTNDGTDSASVALLPGSSAAGGPSSGPGPATSGRECTLLVLVSRAENLPLVMGENGMEVEPDTFVAAKSLREAAGGAAAQTVTRCVARSCRPAWQQVLRLRYPEAALAGEQLLLAVVNNANNRLMMKAALPLAPLVPDKHYNLRLALPSGLSGSAAHLYVTLVLTDCAAAQQRHLRSHAAAAKQLLQARLASVSAPLTPPGSSATTNGSPQGQLFGVWRVASEAAAAEAPQLPGPDPYATLDTCSEAAVAAALHAMADKHAAALKAGADAGGSCAEVLPLRADGGDQRLWPSEHMVSLLAAGSSNSALQLAVYQVPPSSSAQAAGSPAPAAPELSQADRLLGAPAGEVIPVPAAAVPSAPRESSTGAPKTEPAADKPARLLGWASVTLPAQAAGGSGSGQVQVLEGILVRPAAGKAAAAPSATAGGEAADGGKAEAEAGTAQGAQGGGAPASVTVSLEVRQRDTAAVLATLESEVNARPVSGQLPVEAQGMDAKSAVTWQAGAAAALGLSAGGGGSGGVGEASAAGPVVEVLVEHCILMQGALGRLIRQLDTAAAQALVAAWRVSDAENRYRSVTDDNNKLRQLLHEEKQASRAPPLLRDTSTLSRDELIVSCEAAMAAYGRERRRNAELVHRLQQMHAEQVDTIELKKRYQQLQEAHMEQARAYAEIDAKGRRMGQLQATLKMQEEIIRNLEGLLAQAVEKAKSEASAERSLRSEHEQVLVAAQQLEEHCKAQDARVPELESQLAAAQQTLASQEAELEVLRRHTTTEFRADGSSGEPGPDYQRVAQMEELLGAARRRNKELEAGEAARQAAEDNLRKLEADVGKLVEEKTAALLRAEYAEGAAAAAQEELLEVTKKFARDIAELKTRLAEKDAMLMGGFGDLDQLRRGELPHPADMGMGGLGAIGGFDPARLGTPPGMMMPIPGMPPPPPSFPQRQLSQRRSSAMDALGVGGMGPGPGLSPSKAFGAGLGPGPEAGLGPGAMRVRSAEGRERGGRGGAPPAAGIPAGPPAAAAGRPASQGAPPAPSPTPPLLPPINAPSPAPPEDSSPPPADSAAQPGRTRARLRGRRPASPPKEQPAQPPQQEPAPPPPPPPPDPPAQAPQASADEGGNGKDDAGSPPPAGDEGGGGRRALRAARRRK